MFSIRVLRDERICIIAEQRPDCTEEEVRVDCTSNCLEVVTLTVWVWVCM